MVWVALLASIVALVMWGYLVFDVAVQEERIERLQGLTRTLALELDKHRAVLKRDGMN